MNEDLEKLKAEYAASLPLKAAAVQKLVDQVIHHLGMRIPPSWEELEKKAHALTGSSGTYGFMKISDVLRELEVAIANKEIPCLSAKEAAARLTQWKAHFQDTVLKELGSREEKQAA